MLKDIFSMSMYNINSRKLRSGLTLLGIIIGVAAVIATISLGIGMQTNLVDQFDKFMGDVIVVVPGKMSFSMGPSGGAGEVTKLTNKDIKIIENVDGVLFTVGSISSTATVESNGNTGKLTIVGINNPDNWEKIQTSLSDMESGRWFSAGEGNVIVIGNGVAHTVFSKEIDLKKTLEINGKDFRVIGILREAGGFMASYDSSIYMDIDNARDLFPGQFDNNEYSSISAKIDSKKDADGITTTMEEDLRNLHKQNEDTQSFTLITSKFFAEQIGSIMSSFTSFLMMLGVISLLIGGIGIMNIMYVSVMERTKEIGTMKAIGATNSTIMLMFLFEAAIFGLIGGVAGNILGIGLSYGFASLLSGMGMSGSLFVPYISLELIGMGITFGVIVGVLAGYFPAKRASKLQPVEALRYE
ncbi:MAG: ABC transporter permease [Candidatus Aenigmatarchaeota archaeon]